MVIRILSMFASVPADVPREIPALLSSRRFYINSNLRFQICDLTVPYVTRREDRHAYKNSIFVCFYSRVVNCTAILTQITRNRPSPILRPSLWLDGSMFPFIALISGHVFNTRAHIHTYIQTYTRAMLARSLARVSLLARREAPRRVRSIY